MATGEMRAGDPGDVGPPLAGGYVLESRLGSGGMGVVHLGRSASGRRVAVKVVHEQFAADPEFRARFRQEVAAARRVSGAFTAPVVDADPDAERPWMATLYVPGLTLSERVKSKGPLGADELWQLAAGLSEALRDIHRAGVVHRDLKPSNVLLADDGPKVIDFGISRPFDSDLRTETGKVIGTPPFMAPEQFRSPRAVGPAADVFALGCLLVHAALGRGPFDADSPYLVAYQVVHDEPDLGGVPEVLRPLVGRCLAKEPGERPSPGDLMAALREARSPGADGPPLMPSATSVPSAPSAPARRRRPGRRAVLSSLAAALLVAAATVVGVLQLQGDEGPKARSGGTRPHDAPAAAAPAWEREIAAPGARESGETVPARCAYTRAALYCSGSGVAAARVDTRDGDVRWTREAAWADRWAEAPYVSGGLVLVVQPGKRLEALDPETGELRWSTGIAGYDGCCTFAGDTVLLVTGSGVVTALDGATGERLWRKRVPGHPRPVLRYTDGTLLAFSVSDDGARTRVSALRPESGSVEWDFPLPGNLMPAGVSDGLVYLTESGTDVSETSAVVRYDPAEDIVIRTPLPYPVHGATAVVRPGTVYLLGRDGGLVSVDTTRQEAEHAVRWRLETGVSNPSPATISDSGPGGRLYFSASDGRLIAVDLGSGRLAGQTAPRFDADLRGPLQGQPAPIAAYGRVYGFTPRTSVFSVPAGDLRKSG